MDAKKENKKEKEFCIFSSFEESADYNAQLNATIRGVQHLKNNRFSNGALKSRIKYT